MACAPSSLKYSQAFSASYGGVITLEVSQIKKLNLSVILLFIAIPISVMVAWQVYTIHDSVNEGSAYGFYIGATKKETYSVISQGTSVVKFFGHCDFARWLELMETAATISLKHSIWVEK